jgi:hypothetical protein
MTVCEIVKAWLIENGYDALAGDDCGCHVEGLAPCGNISGDCVAGWWDEGIGMAVPGKMPDTEERLEQIRAEFRASGERVDALIDEALQGGDDAPRRPGPAMRRGD